MAASNEALMVSRREADYEQLRKLIELESMVIPFLTDALERANDQAKQIRAELFPRAS